MLQSWRWFGPQDPVSLEQVRQAGGHREAEGLANAHIPMRPDHGHLLADDIGNKSNPDYFLVGRLKSLAELSGIIAAVDQLHTA